MPGFRSILFLLSLTRTECLSTMPSFKTRAILFDIDGTLVDSWKLGFDATQVILRKHGIPPISEDAYHSCTIYATPDRLARHAGLDPSDDSFDAVGGRLAREFDDLYVNLVSTETASLFPGVGDLLSSFPRDAKLGALTNACVAYARSVLKTHELDGEFSSVRGADDVPAPKPSGDGLLACCEELGVRPEECVYVGDSPGDGLAARAAGMPAIGVLWGSHSLESLQSAPFEHICDNVDDLRNLLLQKVIGS